MEIDRRKHDIDILERVLGTARERDDGVPHEMVRREVKAWFGGTATSVVQMTIARGGDEPAEGRDRGR